MKPKKVSINVSHLPISIFGECTESIALPVLDRILSKPERQKMILGAKIIVLSNTGLANALVIELQKKFGDDLPVIVQVDFSDESSKKFITDATEDCLSRCEEIHDGNFKLAVHRFATDAKRRIAQIYRDQAPYLDEPVTLILESFLLAPLSKLLREPEIQENDEKDFDDEKYSDTHPMH